jgi:hypothetical protein
LCKPSTPAVSEERQEARCKIAFLNLLERDPSFDAILKAYGEDPFASMVTDSDIEPFVDLDTASKNLIREFQRKPQLSVAFQTKQRDNSNPDDYRAEAILDYGISDRLTLTGNASYDLKNNIGQRDDQGGHIAGSLQFQPFLDKLKGPKPIRFTLAGEGTWMEGMSPIYKGQLKVNLPIPRLEALSGVEIPVSVTVSNRTELINETEVRGMIGFTVDTSHLLAALTH